MADRMQMHRVLLLRRIAESAAVAQRTWKCCLPPRKEMGPFPLFACGQARLSALGGELPSRKGQGGEGLLRGRVERTPPTQSCTLEMAPLFRFSTQAILERPQILWLRPWISCGRGMPGGNLPTAPALPQYLLIIIRAPKSDSRLHTQRLGLSCSPSCLSLPSPTKTRTSKDIRSD